MKWSSKKRRQKKRLQVISGVGGVTAFRLLRNGFETVADVAEADMSELTDVYYVGERRAAQIRSNARAIIGCRGEEVDQKRTEQVTRVAVVGGDETLADVPYEDVDGIIAGAIMESEMVTNRIGDVSWSDLEIGYIGYDDFGDRVARWLDESIWGGRRLGGRRVLTGDAKKYRAILERPDEYTNGELARFFSDIPYTGPGDDLSDVSWRMRYAEQRTMVVQWADVVVIPVNWEYAGRWRGECDRQNTECVTFFEQTPAGGYRRFRGADEELGGEQYEPEFEETVVGEIGTNRDETDEDTDGDETDEDTDGDEMLERGVTSRERNTGDSNVGGGVGQKMLDDWV